jgi:hypothetical protein
MPTLSRTFPRSAQAAGVACVIAAASGAGLLRPVVSVLRSKALRA